MRYSIVTENLSNLIFKFVYMYVTFNMRIRKKFTIGNSGAPKNRKIRRSILLNCTFHVLDKDNYSLTQIR